MHSLLRAVQYGEKQYKYDGVTPRLIFQKGGRKGQRDLMGDQIWLRIGAIYESHRAALFTIAEDPICGLSPQLEKGEYKASASLVEKDGATALKIVFKKAISAKSKDDPDGKVVELTPEDAGYVFLLHSSQDEAMKRFAEHKRVMCVRTNDLFTKLAAISPNKPIDVVIL